MVQWAFNKHEHDNGNEIGVCGGFEVEVVFVRRKIAILDSFWKKRMGDIATLFTNFCWCVAKNLRGRASILKSLCMEG